MATPQPDSYSCASGGSIYGGMSAPVIGHARIVQDGDSLTSFEYQSDPARWGVPLTRYPPMIVANLGHPNDTTADILGRQAATLASAVTHGATALMLRMGTNGPGSPGSGAGGVGSGDLLTDYALWVDNAIAAGQFVYCHQIPPTSGGGAGKITTNNGIAAICAARPSDTLYVADGDAMADGSYNALSGMLLDGIHHAPLGQYTSGKAQSTLIGFPSNDPRITDGTDTYAQNSGSNQWVVNPLMTGTGGTVSVGTGTAPTSWQVGTAGLGSFTASIIASDGGDANTTPWLRLHLLTGVSPHSFNIETTLNHPAIAASYAALMRCDAVMECRMVGLDTTNLGRLNFFVHSAYTTIAPALAMGLTGCGTLTEHMVLRTSFQRSAATGYSANSLGVLMQITLESNFSSPIGYVDVRCASVRGLTT